jgi:hypothetical protein
MEAGEGIPFEVWTLAATAASAAFVAASIYTVTDFVVRRVERELKFNATDKLLDNHLNTKGIDSNDKEC